MAITNKWWENREGLLQHNIDSQYDIISHKMRFRKTWHEDGDSMKRMATVQLDMDMLEQGGYTPRDLIFEFEGIRVRDPDYVNPGPTNRELQDPRIRRAWEEMNILRRLIR